jgi:hypothetical protein
MVVLCIVVNMMMSVGFIRYGIFVKTGRINNDLHIAYRYIVEYTVNTRGQTVLSSLIS